MEDPLSRGQDNVSARSIRKLGHASRVALLFAKKYETFESVTLDIPLSTRGTDEYKTAIGKLKTLATRVADERGSAEIDLAYSNADVNKLKVKQESVSVKTDKGGVITVTTLANANIPKGIERYTVRAGKIQNTEL